MARGEFLEILVVPILVLELVLLLAGALHFRIKRRGRYMCDGANGQESYRLPP